MQPPSPRIPSRPRTLASGSSLAAASASGRCRPHAVDVGSTLGRPSPIRGITDSDGGGSVHGNRRLHLRPRHRGSPNSVCFDDEFYFDATQVDVPPESGSPRSDGWVGSPSSCRTPPATPSSDQICSGGSSAALATQAPDVMLQPSRRHHSTRQMISNLSELVERLQAEQMPATMPPASLPPHLMQLPNGGTMHPGAPVPRRLASS